MVPAHKSHSNDEKFEPIEACTMLILEVAIYYIIGLGQYNIIATSIAVMNYILTQSYSRHKNCLADKAWEHVV
mgnify:CR=1 FL=1